MLTVEPCYLIVNAVTAEAYVNVSHAYPLDNAVSHRRLVTTQVGLLKLTLPIASSSGPSFLHDIQRQYVHIYIYYTRAFAKKPSDTHVVLIYGQGKGKRRPTYVSVTPHNDRCVGVMIRIMYSAS